MDLHRSISNGFVSSKIYDKRDDFDFDIVNFPFLDGDVPRRPSYDILRFKFSPSLVHSHCTNLKRDNRVPVKFLPSFETFANVRYCGINKVRTPHPVSIYLHVLSRSFSDHHRRCDGWLDFEFSKREKHSGWAIRTFYKKLSRGMLKHIHLYR